MKNEKGITLISLVLYVILMTIIVTIVVNITAAFYSSLNEFDRESESAVAFSKFNMYFLNDIKKAGAAIGKTTDTSIEVTYMDRPSVVYSIQNKVLYRDSIKICDGIDDSKITSYTDANTVKVSLTMGEYKKTTTYVAENYSD